MKFFAFIITIFGLSFLFVPLAFASSGTISIPNNYYARNTPYAGLVWQPNEYTESPYLDPFHYWSTASETSRILTGVLYNNGDNSVAASGMWSNVGSNGWMVLQYGDFGTNFQNNTPYYFIITDPNTGQTYQTPCFEDTGNDGQLVACPGNTPPSFQPLSNVVVNQGGTYSASGSFTDPDSTSWTGTVDYGDGSGSQALTFSGTSFTLSHQYNTQGTYFVTVSVTDNQGATAGATAKISVAGTGTISIPNNYYARNTPYAGLVWQPNEYTVNPYFDPFDYNIHASNYDYFTSVLYNESDNSIAASGMWSNVGGNGWMVLQYGDFGTNFQNNTPYYTILTDVNTGQTYQTPCFEDTGNDNQLVACPVNQPPHINSFSGDTINEGDTYSASGSFTDPDSTSWTATIDYGDGSGSQSLTLSGTNFSLSHIYKDNGTYTVSVSVTDNQGATGTGTATVTVNNVAPTPGAITVSNPVVQVNNSITASANFTDPGVLDTHTASWNWGDGNTTTGTVTEPNGSNPGSVSDSHTYTATGVYTITLTVTDNNSGAGTSTFQYVSVYDSNSSFAGGRSFDNPSSASPSTSGKVSFGVSSKYNNSNVLTGSVKMNFKAASLDFASTSLTSLATSNGKAYLKGSGTLNGTAGYTFLATGIDGSVAGGNDLIRFQIKDSSNNVVYDSQPGAGDTADPTTTDATGNIRVH